MRTSDIDILIVPGWSSSGPDHWQTRWQKRLVTAQRVEQDDWIKPSRADWVARLKERIGQCKRPVVIVAHSLGVIALAHACQELDEDVLGKIAGAFLVAPADVDNSGGWPVTNGEVFSRSNAEFSPIPCAKLPFRSVLISSSDDPYCAPERASTLAALWGATFVDAGEAGHINVASGHGPWPEGLMRFGVFLKELD